MLGPCLLEQGGMGAVQQHIINGVSKKYNIKHVTTWDGKSNSLLLFSKASIIFLYQLIINNVDIVHLHVSERGSVLRKSILALVAFIFSKPVIMHTHGCEFHLFYDNLPTIAQKIVNKIFQNCSCVIVLSKSWQQTYIEKCSLAPDRVLLKYNPVVIPPNIPDRKDCNKITFLVLGKINQRKGIFDLLEAISELSINYQSKIELIIAGDGEIKKAISLAEKLKIDSLITFPGWVDSKQRDILLKQANVFILSSYNEGLPMALIEAMSWSLPVITTPVGGIPEIVSHKETGLLVNPGAIPELKTSIQTLIYDEPLRLKLGKAAYEKALLLDIENYSHDMLSIYNSILKKKQKQLL